MFDQNKFNQFILDNDFIKFSEQPITLKSGKVSHVYVNWRNAANDAFLLDKTTDYIKEFIKAKIISFDSIYGVPEGATKLAVITALKLARSSKNYSARSHVIPMGRAKPKEHGDPQDRFFVGAPQGKTIVIEDVTTTGSSLIETIDNLHGNGIEVTAAVALTNRMEKRDDGKSVAEAIKEKYKGKIQYMAMSATTDLLPLIAREQKPKQHILKAVEQEFKLFGVQPITLT